MRVLIIGAGQVAVQVASSLRKRGFDGSITIFGNEGLLPYKRPPLSKTYIKQAIPQERLYFKPSSFYDEHDIETHTGARVTHIDRAAGCIRCQDGERHGYDRLIICTGSHPINIPVPGNDLEGVYCLRGLRDADRLREALKTPGRVSVIGGGYIGLEAAASARQLGHCVTVIEREQRLLSRVTSPVISDYFADCHRTQGVDVLLGNSVSAVLGSGHTTGVALGDGESVDADIVLVGIGVHPTDELAAAAGIQCANGILVNPDSCQTSDPGVYAAGDCARQDFGDGTTLRLESVHNALVQADKIAAHITGSEPPLFEPPWFWSDQYDRKLQTVGLFNGHDAHVVRGNMEAGRFSVFYFDDQRLLAVDSVNDPATFMLARKALRSATRIDRRVLSDPDFDIRTLAAAG